MTLKQDQIRGCLFGGAVGDALGYPVEFMREKKIFRTYGSKGICAYDPDPYSDGQALISDDTQMVLFTANGLLNAQTQNSLDGTQTPARVYIQKAYQDWLITQETIFERRSKMADTWKKCTWLADVPELCERRAPGTTCLNALKEQYRMNSVKDDYVKMPVNTSKGCGGVMRAAPMGLVAFDDIRMADYEGAQAAAITHGHSLGYMPAAVLTHIIQRIVFPEDEKQTLKQMIIEAEDTVKEIFAGDDHLNTLINIIDLAVDLSENTDSDLANIRRLGEGWVAEEALGIALYCSLKYQNDFSAAVTVSVNHNGDSDSTGAITGNIVGALLGYSQIDDSWKQHLELDSVILEMADDLAKGCPKVKDGCIEDKEWRRKYIDAQWKAEV